MIERIRLLLRGLAANSVGKAGVVLATSAFTLFLLFELSRLFDLLTNTFVCLVAYMTLPTLLILGLILICLGWLQLRRTSGLSTADLLADRFPPQMLKRGPLVTTIFGTGLSLAVLCLLLLGLGTTHMLHFMEEPRFCGTACHHLMIPEWTAYQASPHANVRCVDCHVGEGVGAMGYAKLNGLWQVISSSLDLYERPIPTPVHQLRPARETCEKCHWPDRFYGDRIRTFAHFDFDRESTLKYTTLALKVGSGKGDNSGEIHWHIAAENEIRYMAANEDRSEIAWVEVRRGEDFWRYQNTALGATHAEGEAEPVRTMDCVDCHNRATHIFQDPEELVDELMASGDLSRDLPWAKREYMKALTGAGGSDYTVIAGIDNSLHRAWRNDPDVNIGNQDIDRAVSVLTASYERNVHPDMEVDWNTYASHLGHRNSPGCFRCHNRDMVDSEGHAVGYDCTLCHSILALESETPFRFLQPLEEKDPLQEMHRSLQEEFTGAEASRPVVDDVSETDVEANH